MYYGGGFPPPVAGMHSQQDFPLKFNFILSSFLVQEGITVPSFLYPFSWQTLECPFSATIFSSFYLNLLRMSE